MNSVRYLVALFLVISLPPLFLYWLLVHPFVNFWRGRGIGVTYGCLLTVITAGMIGLFSIRHFLLSIEYGTSYPLAALALVLLGLSGTMRFMIQKKLTMKVLLGLPEVAPDRFPRELVTDGLYARMRHPRYVQFLIALAGYALIANYLAAYLIVALWVPAVYIIVLLEEKELRDHFGQDYIEYCRRVPRFVPKLNARHWIQ
ncbi:MAG TPA: isoprenylcysteine carboxylmethyltransferase family protein [Candidatus Binatia bacterium]|jgi:protein-S-isoprenylcysteine O-methyltransferase Ste14